MIHDYKEKESGPGQERDSNSKEGQEPATRKRRWGDELHEKVKHIDTEVEGLNQLANDHNLRPYLSDILHKFIQLSSEVQQRLIDLHKLDHFLVRISFCPPPLLCRRGFQLKVLNI